MNAQEEIKVGQFTVTKYTVERLQSEMFPVSCGRGGISFIEVDFEKRTIRADSDYDSGIPENVWNRRAIWMRVHRASIGESLFDFIRCEDFATYIDKQLDDYLNDDQDIDYDEIDRLVERNVDAGEVYSDDSFQEFGRSNFYNLCYQVIYDENGEITLSDPMDIYDHVHQALLELEAQDVVEECYDLEDFDEKFSDLSNDEFACSYSDVKAHLEQISVEAKAILEAKEAA